ncbi:uncharacterized protein METZ01_LOCUS96267, partial [marine metagenome]
MANTASVYFAARSTPLSEVPAWIRTGPFWGSGQRSMDAESYRNGLGARSGGPL